MPKPNFKDAIKKQAEEVYDRDVASLALKLIGTPNVETVGDTKALQQRLEKSGVGDKAFKAWTAASGDPVKASAAAQETVRSALQKQGVIIKPYKGEAESTKPLTWDAEAEKKKLAAGVKKDELRQGPHEQVPGMETGVAGVAGRAFGSGVEKAGKAAGELKDIVVEGGKVAGRKVADAADEFTTRLGAGAARIDNLAGLVADRAAEKLTGTLKSLASPATGSPPPSSGTSVSNAEFDAAMRKQAEAKVAAGQPVSDAEFNALPQIQPMPAGAPASAPADLAPMAGPEFRPELMGTPNPASLPYDVAGPTAAGQVTAPGAPPTADQLAAQSQLAAQVAAAEAGAPAATLTPEQAAMLATGEGAGGATTLKQAFSARGGGGAPDYLQVDPALVADEAAKRKLAQAELAALAEQSGATSRELTKHVKTTATEYAEQQAAIEGLAASQLKASQDSRQRLDRQMQLREQHMADLRRVAATEVDPNRFWASKDVGQKVMAVIAGALYGFLGQGMDWLKRLDSLVEQDIKIQQLDIDRQVSAAEKQLSVDADTYNMLRQQGLDHVEAISIVKDAKVESVKAYLQRQAMLAGNMERQLKAQEMATAVATQQHALAADRLKYADQKLNQQNQFNLNMYEAQQRRAMHREDMAFRKEQFDAGKPPPQVLANKVGTLLEGARRALRLVELHQQLGTGKDFVQRAKSLGYGDERALQEEFKAALIPLGKDIVGDAVSEGERRLTKAAGIDVESGSPWLVDRRQTYRNLAQQRAANARTVANLSGNRMLIDRVEQELARLEQGTGIGGGQFSGVGAGSAPAASPAPFGKVIGPVVHEQ